MDILTVKDELRTLRKLNHNVNAVICAKEGYDRRIKYIQQSRGTEEAKQATLEKLQKLKSALGADELISEVARIEAAYMPAIKQLNPLEQTIILDSIFNGLSYFEIAAKIGYSRRGVEEKMKRIYEKIEKFTI